MPGNLLKTISKYNFRRRKPDLKASALLVVDMQKFFYHIAKPVIRNIRLLVRNFRDLGIPVIYTRHGHENPARDAGMLNEWWKEHVIKGTAGWQILKEIAPRKGDLIIDKKRYSAFVNTGLEDYLHARGIKELIISGVMTNCCCETTARDAFCKDFRVFFPADGTAAPNDDLHLSSLKTLAYGFAYITTCKELLSSASGDRALSRGSAATKAVGKAAEGLPPPDK